MKYTCLSTSRPFLLFATMSNRNGFSSGLPQKRSFRNLWREKRSRNYVREGSPAMSALINSWSFIGIGMVFVSTRKSNIISEPSSCFHFLSFLRDERYNEKRGRKTHIFNSRKNMLVENALNVDKAMAKSQLQARDLQKFSLKERMIVLRGQSKCTIPKAKKRYLQGSWNEKIVPDMAPGTVTEIMTEPRKLDTTNITVSDLKFLLILYMRRHHPSEIRDT